MASPAGQKRPEQRIHGDGGDAQHTISPKVSKPRVHQHDVDRIGAAALAERALQEEGGGALRERPAHHGQRQPAHAGTGDNERNRSRRRARVSAVLACSAGRLSSRGQPAQAQQDRDGGHHLHDDCVSARSTPRTTGKVMAVHRPARHPLEREPAGGTWPARRALAPPPCQLETRHEGGRWRQCRCRPGACPRPQRHGGARGATSTSHSICHCRRRVDGRLPPRPAT